MSGNKSCWLGGSELWRAWSLQLCRAMGCTAHILGAVQVRLGGKPRTCLALNLYPKPERSCVPMLCFRGMMEGLCCSKATSCLCPKR